MEKITLDVVYTLAGIGSSSGLYFDHDRLFVISDNASVLYRYVPKDDTVSQIPLYAAAVCENIPKKDKPDLEALAFHDGLLYAFGSGSTFKRNRLFCIDVKTESVTSHDLTLLYQRMRTVSGIDVHNFNIEGGFWANGNWFLFQRGNGNLAKNGFFSIDDLFHTSATVVFYEMELPDINGFGSGFTDAVMVDGDCWFLASAENSASTYDDGDVAGSAIGRLNLETGKLTDFTIISDDHKFEGLSFYASGLGSVSFLLCEDNDSDVLEARIYELKISH
ncbi:DUF6929 family protein [Flavobacterium silvaticum]|uniref:Uncharacterized protein n=1 Tax=Flavobacterium silvaticum TaxID=1852020 RepID=A0A972JJF5_9FLAO|nr:hypothetical protein [Flavobacterium silvaticum]NMH29308.1 hypothetical protein [Flavobacterium silvaticum]